MKTPKKKASPRKPRFEVKTVPVLRPDGRTQLEQKSVRVDVYRESPSSAFQLLRDPNIVWYGPHGCPKCGKQIVKTGNGAPALTLNAEEHGHHYPNHQWKEHVCK